MKNDLPPSPPDELDVLVVGAGQTGLAIGWHLQQAGLSFRLVDTATAIGDVWRSRWDSMRLFTAAEYDALPGMAFPAPPGTYPGKDDVANYLQSYVDAFALPVQLDTPVRHLSRTGEGFVAATDSGDVRARQVIVATGPFQTPHVPDLGAGLSTDVQQLHSARYRSPIDITGAEVLVVGGANSGLQIATELARSGRKVTVCVGERPRPVPQRPLGKDLFWWLTRTGLIEATAQSRMGQRLQARELVVGTSWRGLRADGVHVAGRAVHASGDRVQCAEGQWVRADTVVWATGYRPDYSWIAIPEAFSQGRPVHVRGVTSVPGLFFLGLAWQHTRGSALLGFVGSDAAWLMREIGRLSVQRPLPPVATAA